MTRVTLEEARDRLDALLAEAAKGEEVIIAREDGSAFRIVSVGAVSRKRRGLVGSAKGWFVMREDFDAPLEDFDEYT